MTVDAILPFVLSALLLLAAPGPTIVLISVAGASGGKRGGLAAALGSLSAVAVVSALLALGLYNALLAQPFIADALRWAGGALVAWLGIKLVWRREASAQKVAPIQNRSLLLQGFTTTLLNPKIALAYPGMVAAYANGFDPLSSQMAGIFTLCASLVYGATALVAAATAARNMIGSLTARTLRAAAGITMLALAIRIVWPNIAGFIN